MTRRAWVLLVIMLALLIPAIFKSRQEPLLRVGATLINVPNAPRWWARAAACLHDPAPYPSHVRFYVGTTVPAEWVVRQDDGRYFMGYSNTETQQILLGFGGAQDSAIVTHEVWHIVHGRGHPTPVFVPPRCGLARP